MPVYAIVQNTVIDKQKMDEYLGRVGPTLPSDVKLLASDETPELIEGEGQALRTVLVEFPNREVFDAWYNSPEYKELAAMRMEAAPGTAILVEGM